MTVQERQAYVHPAPTQPPPQNVYYSYPYQPLSEDIHANGPQTSLPPPPYTPGPPSTYPPSRDLPTLYNQPSQASYHYSPHEQGQPETVPIRTGSAANLFAQQTYDENNPPSGPSTGDTITSTGSDETIVPPVTSPRRNHVSRVNSDGSPGTFKCQFAGCTAAPFQTQYLLNSHANVHSQTRPHFCPVPGCPRGEKGRGFKRKNEMIRHGLVHDSPGYVCPFCPDREHKYPRPDNLQRHVRVHHTDKSRDDPRLREVLAKRPEGGTRGRRRRAAPP
ncbi:hypothetical protein BDZ91DRAFT_653067 [Kalaharituber pfeilii]|nr:hypothetical protein BDZ91DRAFT_653067 [Kalaharituber pfeilii]